MPPLSVVDLAAPVERVRRLAEEVLGAEPHPAGGDGLVVQVRFPTGDPTPVRLRLVSRAGDVTQVILESDPAPPVPYFRWFVGPILRSAAKRALRWVERALRAAEAG
ncbi:MAG: hypothetical protein QOD57_2425, partial [Actinomycetota bacterium]|nr:hypothetical protein [Actinomycetota bacterium]